MNPGLQEKEASHAGTRPAVRSRRCVAIDAQAAQGRGSGLAVYTRNLIAALLEEKSDAMDLVLCSAGRSGNLNTAGRLFWENVELPSRLRHRKTVDLLHVPAFSPPAAGYRKLVVT